MRILRLTLVALFCSGMLVTLGVGPALACSCAYTQTRDFVAMADEIVAGTLSREEDPPKNQHMSSGDPITYTLGVDRIYRGDFGAEVVFGSAVSGASCGLEGMVVDRRYVVFLNTDGADRTASLCGGTAPATSRLQAAVERLTGAPTQPAGTVDDRSSTDEPPATSTDDARAHTVAPRWTIGIGILGIALLGGAGLWLRRRTP